MDPPDPSHDLLELTQLEQLFDAPREVSVVKEIDHVDANYATWIAASPFCVVATAGPGAPATAAALAGAGDDAIETALGAVHAHEAVGEDPAAEEAAEFALYEAWHGPLASAHPCQERLRSACTAWYSTPSSGRRGAYRYGPAPS